MGLERVRVLSPWLWPMVMGTLITQKVPHRPPNISCPTPAHLPTARTSMGWEGFSTGSSTSGFLG